MALFSRQYSISLFQLASCCRECGSPTITNKLLARVIMTLKRCKMEIKNEINHLILLRGKINTNKIYRTLITYTSIIDKTES